MTYEIEEIDGHVVVGLEEGLFLVDTGSPSSFSRRGRVTFAAETVEVGESAMGMLDADGLSKYVGTRLDGIVGMNVLGRHEIVFVTGKMYVDETEVVDEKGNPIPTESFRSLETEDFMGIPVVGVEIAGRSASVFVDTGAKVSYLDPKRLEGCPVEETLHDFYPGVGEFDVDVSSVECALSGWTLTARFGRLPPLLQMSLMMGGVDGILGHDLFAAFAVRLGVGGKPMSIAPLH